MSLLQLIKQAAIEAVEQSSPMSLTYGTVESISPLKINLEQKISLTNEFIVNTEIFDEAIFSIGDRLVFLRVNGGQKYIYLDKLVDE